VWNPNGRELFFVAGLNSADRRRLMVVQFANGSFRGRPEPLFEFDPRELRIGGGWLRHYDVAKDGRGFYAMRVLPVSPLPPITHINLIQNWFEDLKAKVPVGK
jgi:hypothetical protein